MTVLSLLASVSLASAAVPSSVTESHVTWTDASFKGELGNLPLGNGDVAANVWVDDATGDLLAYIAKSDAFDQNSQPVKVARLRYTFDPPLWTKTDDDAAAAPSAAAAAHRASGGYKLYASTIVSQANGDRIADPSAAGSLEWPASSWAACPAEGAAACDAAAACVAYSCTVEGHATPMFQMARVGLDKAVTHKADWDLYVHSGPTPPPTPPAPTPPPAFFQTLNLTAGAFDVATLDSGGYRVRVLVDAHSPTLRVSATNAGRSFSVTASLDVYRAKLQKTKLGRGFCSPRYDVPDTVLPPPSAASAAASGGASVTWFHRNDYALVNDTLASSYFGETMAAQGVAPGVMADPFVNLTFGGRLSFVGGAGAAQTSDRTLAVAGAAAGTTVVAEATVLTAQTATVAGWLGKLEAAVAREAERTDDKEAAHEAWWEAFWGRSHISLPGRGASASDEQRLVEQHYVWARYLDACDGRSASGIIKFNGQAFVVDEGKGPDYRDWGACYWFQNERQPYYNTLAAGDLDIQRPLYAFYLRSLDAIVARTAAEAFGGASGNATGRVTGGYWPETMTQFGTYNPGDWGCATKPAGPSQNTFIRWHSTGSLELALFALDDFAYTGDVAVMRANLPILRTVLEYYASRYSARDAVTGKMDMWPAQALETYQCPDPSSRTHCATNPSTDVSGLGAVLARALALPASIGVDGATAAAWRALLAALPPLAMAPSRKVKGQQAVQPIADTGYANGRHNSENTALYTVHPFRLYGLGKPDLATAQATYADRPSPCNSGWCQDVVDAAMLNMTAEAASMVAQRATQTSEFRWSGYAGHNQDYEPSEDHFGFMRTAMHYMLLSPLDDAKQSVLLFPTWPTDKWDVDIKLHAPLQTTIEAACTNGTLTKLVVTPSARRADITVMNCANPSEL
jgi:hypothetical protein